MNSITLNEQKVLAVEEQLRQAMKSSDVAMLDQLLHDDLLFVLPSGEVITKQMDLETHQSGNLILQEITSSIDSIKHIEENVIVNLTSNLKGQMLEQHFEANFRYLRVWKMFNGQFKVIAGSGVQL
jgi:hypothetical protein